MSSSTTATPAEPVIRNRDMLALQNYITARDGDPRQGLAETTLLIDLTHSNLVQRHIEIRFDKHDRLYAVREKIHQKTGTAPHFQTLQLRCSGQMLLEIPAGDEAYDHHKLGFFFGDALGNSGLEIRCVDTNPLSGSRNGLYEDTSLVDKYRMSDEEYDRRKGTLRDWGREQRARDETFTLAKHAKEHREKVEAMRQFKLGIFPLPHGYVVDSTGKDICKGDDEPDYDDLQRANKDKDAKSKSRKSSSCCPEEEDTAETSGVGPSSVAGMTVGNRCRVHPGSRRGTVSFVGVVPELDDREDSQWVGVTFDEPVGKTDGSATNTSSGKQTYYFEAPHGYASFVRGKNVEVGDFPELDLFDSDSDSEDEDEL